ncbi:MAG: CHRD domain-containing protein [Bryobacterales bacterium]|nr:CHRD domain-containing protein [Bryobacteraceae bacterium]MDW8353958.1 CHRD domain-containing protein [Bryobacterales bacterium]
MPRLMLAGLCVSILSVLARAQTTEVVRFRALLSSSKEIPPVTAGTLAMGEAVVEFVLQRSAAGTIQSGMVDFRISYTLGQEETLTDMHIHRGGEGVSGPVVVRPAFGTPFAASGTGSFFRVASVTDSAGIATLEAIMANPAGYYINIHSRSNPPGLMRGQLEPDTTAIAAVRAAETRLDAKLDRVDGKLDTIMTMIRNLALVHGLRLP